jgi:hypothetical protein
MALSLAFKLFAACAILGALLFLVPEPRDLSVYMLTRQDTLVLALGAALLFVLTRRTLPFRLPEFKGRAFAVAAAIASAVIGYAGAYLVALNFPLSMDEFMAVFDAEIFRGGHLLAPLAPEWQAYAKALQPIFLLQSGNTTVWSSNYLPVNAALHALFMWLGDRALTAPVLAAVAVLALYGIARRLWPKRPDAAVVAVLLLVTSSQFLITAMTPYAMTAHLALNLVWLYLFLRNTGASHGGALVVGFAASGLHQVIFHPLFAAPFVLMLWVQRRFRLAAIYTMGYAAICLFWVFYWALILPPLAGSASGLSAFLMRAWEFLTFDLGAFGLMVRNLARFIAWQNPFVLVLFIAALGSIRLWKSPMPQLLGGIVLTLVAMTFVMPFQGHGWGYRYLHGLLGNLSLMAAYGWVNIGGRRIAPMRGALAACTVFAVLMLPLRGWQVRSFTEPYAAAYESIRTTDADLVFVDPTDSWYGGDLVRNDPYLRGRPKVLVLNFLNESDMRRLCARNTVEVFERNDAAHHGIPFASTNPTARRHTETLLADLKRLGCRLQPPR